MRNLLNVKPLDIPCAAYHASGDINGTYEYGCQLFKKRVESAIMMKAAQTQED